MNKKYPKKNHVTEPNIISKYYFNFMKNKIIEVGNFHEKKNVLDYGCGTGDLKKLKDIDNTEVTLRVHDACLNSDCFRGTICTCAPYLFWSIEKAIETAQRGGVGFVFYFKKEGRSLGEVIKFRVYSAREGQDGGDSSENYFDKTTEIAGIEDIRFQEVMPDALLWLGINKIDHLYSMSNVKYDALVDAGIKVHHRHEIPKECISKDAHVEIAAKIKSGYFSK